jgi:hypothetical protein
MTIRKMPRTVRTTVTTRKIIFRPLGPCSNEKNCIDEGLLFIGDGLLHHCLLIPSNVAPRTLLRIVSKPTHCYRTMFTEIDTCSISLRTHSSI